MLILEVKIKATHNNNLPLLSPSQWRKSGNWSKNILFVLLFCLSWGGWCKETKVSETLLYMIHASNSSKVERDISFTTTCFSKDFFMTNVRPPPHLSFVCNQLVSSQLSAFHHPAISAVNKASVISPSSRLLKLNNPTSVDHSLHLSWSKILLRNRASSGWVPLNFAS